jgi:hypothetical protein
VSFDFWGKFRKPNPRREICFQAFYLQDGRIFISVGCGEAEGSISVAAFSASLFPNPRLLVGIETAFFVFYGNNTICVGLPGFRPGNPLREASYSSQHF